VDRFGERKVFIADGVVLLFICAGFAYSRNVNILYFLYILDNLMFSTRIARTTYLNKIARDKREIPATISLGITMDHLLSMTAPIFAGILWHALGYSMIFIAASGIAVLGIIIAMMIRIPREKNYRITQ
jgi:MFS family permease